MFYEPCFILFNLHDRVHSFGGGSLYFVGMSFILFKLHSFHFSSFCWFSCFVVNANFAPNLRFSSPEGASSCLRVDSQISHLGKHGSDSILRLYEFQFYYIFFFNFYPISFFVHEKVKSIGLFDRSGINFFVFESDSIDRNRYVGIIRRIGCD